MVCASCNNKTNVKDCEEVLIEDVNVALLKHPDHRISDGRVVDDLWLDNSCHPPPMPAFNGCLQDVLLAPAGLISEQGVPVALQLCLSCRNSLKRGCTPDLALANHLYIGDISEELTGLTVVEETLIAHCHAKSCIIQLRETVEGLVPNAQCVMRGLSIVFPQQPEYMLDLLPHSIDNVATYICVICMGSSPPTAQWLHRHARPLLVHKQRVEHALRWLQLHNRHYKHIQINMDVLENLEEESILPVHIDIIPSTGAQELLLSGYDSQTCPDVPFGQSSDHDVFHSMVVTDVDSSSLSSVLCAAAMEHIKNKGARYIQIPHGSRPVGDFNNPSLLPMIFPTLFPYGLGGCEDCRWSHPVSLQRHARYFLTLADT